MEANTPRKSRASQNRSPRGSHSQPNEEYFTPNSTSRNSQPAAFEPTLIMNQEYEPTLPMNDPAYDPTLPLEPTYALEPTLLMKPASHAGTPSAQINLPSNGLTGLEGMIVTPKTNDEFFDNLLGSNDSAQTDDEEPEEKRDQEEPQQYNPFAAIAQAVQSSPTRVPKNSSDSDKEVLHLPEPEQQYQEFKIPTPRSQPAATPEKVPTPRASQRSATSQRVPTPRPSFRASTPQELPASNASSYVTKQFSPSDDSSESDTSQQLSTANASSRSQTTQQSSTPGQSSRIATPQKSPTPRASLRSATPQQAPTPQSKRSLTPQKSPTPTATSRSATPTKSPTPRNKFRATKSPTPRASSRPRTPAKEATPRGFVPDMNTPEQLPKVPSRATKSETKAPESGSSSRKRKKIQRTPTPAKKHKSSKKQYSTRKEPIELRSSAKPPPKVYVFLYDVSQANKLRYSRDLKNMGVGIETDWTDRLTHAVIHKAQISLRVALAVNKGVHLVSEEWIQESQREGELLDPKNYPVKLRNGTNLSSVAKDRKKVLRNKQIWIMKEVRPMSRNWANAIREAGGVLSKSKPVGRNPNFLVVTTEGTQDRKEVEVFRKNKYEMRDSKWFLNLLVTHERI